MGKAVSFLAPPPSGGFPHTRSPVQTYPFARGVVCWKGVAA